VPIDSCVVVHAQFAETVGYVSNIYKYYLGWKLTSEREAARAQLKQAQTHKASPSKAELGHLPHRQGYVNRGSTAW
jgi:hypothetical protein